MKGNLNSTIDMDQRDSIVEKHREYAEKLARRFMRSMQIQVEVFDELLSAAYLGLVEAATNFDPTKGGEFERYAYFRIKGAVIDFLRESSELSEHAYRYARALGSTDDQQELSSAVDTWQGSRELSVDEKLAKLFEYAAKGAIAYRVSMEDWDESGELDVGDSETPEAKLQLKQHNKELREVVESLPEKERHIIVQHYFKGRSFVDIAQDYNGFSKSWVSRLHAKALDKIKLRFIERSRDEGI